MRFAAKNRVTAQGIVQSFNLKDWRGPDELVHDGRWNGYGTPPTSPPLLGGATG